LLFSGKQKIGLVDIILFMLIVLAFFSTNYAIDFEKAFFGEQYRYDGLLTILCYYFLVLNVKSIKNEKYKKIIVKLFISIGVFQAMYGILQSYSDFTFIRHHSSGHMAMGLCSNPNFFGSYMVMQVLIVGFMYIYNPKKKYLIIYILFSMALYLAESTGQALSVVLTFIFSIFMVRKKIKRIINLIFILLLTFGFTYLSLYFVHPDH
jgi:putative inorganic carbon (HCO3(-)) transporter